MRVFVIYGDKRIGLFYCVVFPNYRDHPALSTPRSSWTTVPVLASRWHLRKPDRFRLVSNASLPGRLVVALPRSIQGFSLVMFVAVGCVTRIVSPIPVLLAYEGFTHG